MVFSRKAVMDEKTQGYVEDFGVYAYLLEPHSKMARRQDARLAKLFFNRRLIPT